MKTFRMAAKRLPDSTTSAHSQQRSGAPVANCVTCGVKVSSFAPREMCGECMRLRLQHLAEATGSGRTYSRPRIGDPVGKCVDCNQIISPFAPIAMCGECMTRRLQHLEEATGSARIGLESMTTLAELPGVRIVDSFGVVSVLTGTSGFSATDLVWGELARVAANRRGANAVVGITASPFGANGGITSEFGEDAVGILAVGTAVRVEGL